jgi:hypothetical protein
MSSCNVSSTQTAASRLVPSWGNPADHSNYSARWAHAFGRAVDGPGHLRDYFLHIHNATLAHDSGQLTTAAAVSAAIAALSFLGLFVTLILFRAGIIFHGSNGLDSDTHTDRRTRRFWRSRRNKRGWGQKDLEEKTDGREVDVPVY